MHMAIIFFLILARIVGLMVSAPLFNRREIFNMARVALIIWMTGLLFFVVPAPTVLPESIFAFSMMFILEFVIGFIIGFIADLFVIAIEFAGSLMDTQAGLSVASLLDPSSGRNITLISQVLKWTAIILFLQIEGHHMVIVTLKQSFNILPLGAPIDITKGSQLILPIMAKVFEIGVILSAPILLVVFMVDFAFGLLNRIAEQINVFQLGFQIKPSVSLFVFLAISPSLVNSIYAIMETLTTLIFEVLVGLQIQ